MSIAAREEGDTGFADRRLAAAAWNTRRADALAALISHADATRNPVSEAFTAEQEERRCPAR